MPPTGCDASGKAEKNAGGESSLSLAAFFCFHSARGDAWFVSSSFVRKHQYLIILFIRRPESRGGTPLARGTGGAEPPARKATKMSPIKQGDILFLDKIQCFPNGFLGEGAGGVFFGHKEYSSRNSPAIFNPQGFLVPQLEQKLPAFSVLQLGQAQLPLSAGFLVPQLVQKLPVFSVLHSGQAQPLASPAASGASLAAGAAGASGAAGAGT